MLMSSPIHFANPGQYMQSCACELNSFQFVTICTYFCCYMLLPPSVEREALKRYHLSKSNLYATLMERQRRFDTEAISTHN